MNYLNNTITINLLKLKYCCFIVWLISSFNSAAQQQSPISIQGKLLYAKQALKLNQWLYNSPHTDSIMLTNVQFYLSKIELLNNGKIVWQEPNSYHLLSADDSNSLRIQLPTPTNIVFTCIHFHIGIDSATNYAGAQGGDLDPTKGMYWTWQNGYINCKLEGKSTQCNTRYNEFTFHIGGYLFPDNALQTVNIPCNNTNNVDLNIDITKWFDGIDLSKQNHVMSPGQEAVLLANKLVTLFSIPQK
ncbi:MAG: MbnP family protein [Bacteroidota bacterium]